MGNLAVVYESKGRQYVSVRFNHALKHLYTVKCGNRFLVGVCAKCQRVGGLRVGPSKC